MPPKRSHNADDAQPSLKDKLQNLQASNARGPRRNGAASIINGQKPVVDGIDGLAVTRLILKMEESARSRQPVEIGPLFG